MAQMRAGGRGMGMHGCWSLSRSGSSTGEWCRPFCRPDTGLTTAFTAGADPQRLSPRPPRLRLAPVPAGNPHPCSVLAGDPPSCPVPAGTQSLRPARPGISSLRPARPGIYPFALHGQGTQSHPPLPGRVALWPHTTNGAVPQESRTAPFEVASDWQPSIEPLDRGPR